MITAYIKQTPQFDGFKITEFSLSKFREKVREIYFSPRPALIHVYNPTQAEILLQFLESEYPYELILVFHFDNIPKTILSRVETKQRKPTPVPVFGASKNIDIESLDENPHNIYRELILSGQVSLVPFVSQLGVRVLNYTEVL